MNAADDLCATRAQIREDPMLGTALHVRRFLLVEHHGPWPFHALEAPGLDPAVVSQLVASTRLEQARTLLIRRPGRRSEDASVRSWAVADVESGRIRWGSWEQSPDLLAAREVLGQDSADWSDDPAVLVCAHGRHDTCCAVRGRPVAAALAEAYGDAVWECSHVGGDRFAANVVVLPDGTYYGGMDDLDSVAVVRDHLDGRVDPRSLRGNSSMIPVVQAAAVGAHQQLGPAGPRDVRLDRLVDLGQGRWRVSLLGSGPLPPHMEVELGTRHLEPAVLTCAATRPTSARTFVVERVWVP